MYLEQAIEVLEKWEALCRENDEEKGLNIHELMRAIKIVLPIVRRELTEEKRRIVVGEVCGNCARWKRTYDTRQGGQCPIPIRGMSRPKYRTRLMKACLKFTPKKGLEEQE